MPGVPRLVRDPIARCPWAVEPILRTTTLMHRSALVAAAYFAAFMGCAPAAVEPDLGGTLHDTVPSLLAAHDIPGLALAVVRQGEVEWEGGFGERNAATGAPVTPETVFEAASLSKPVFAYLVMALAHDNVIDLDTPITRYLPEREGLEPRLGAVTGRQLLSHTGGLGSRLRDGEVIVEAEPGSRWRYSGAGYVLLQWAVENVTGQSLEVLARTHVFEPLGMTRSGFGWEPGFAEDAAAPHDSAGRPLDPVRYDDEDVDRAGAASTLYTTASDFVRFLAAVSGPEAEPWVRAMFEPQAGVDEDLALSWGLGWAIQRNGAADLAFHWGANPHFRTFALVEPATGRGWVALTNGPLGLELMDELSAVVSGATHPLFQFYMMHPTD